MVKRERAGIPEPGRGQRPPGGPGGRCRLPGTTPGNGLPPAPPAAGEGSSVPPWGCRSRFPGNFSSCLSQIISYQRICPRNRTDSFSGRRNSLRSQDRFCQMFQKISKTRETGHFPCPFVQNSLQFPSGPGEFIFPSCPGFGEVPEENRCEAVAERGTFKKSS